MRANWRLGHTRQHERTHPNTLPPAAAYITPNGLLQDGAPAFWAPFTRTSRPEAAEMETVHDGRIKSAHGAKASNCFFFFFDKPVIYPYLSAFHRARKTRSQMEGACVRGLSQHKRAGKEPENAACRSAVTLRALGLCA